MANDLTGNFDVVAEFAILAVDRVLAAMHRAERFPHSMTLRVRDNAPAGSRPDRPVIVASVDAFGDPTVDHTRIRAPIALPGQFSATDPRSWALDTIVNTDVLVAYDPPLVPSKLQGRAQLQLFPPRIEVTDAHGSNITVKLALMARYFPDPHTPRVAEFVRGELQITAPVGQVASQRANLNVVDIDIKADNVNINFDPKWSSQPLSAEDLAGVNLLIHNALKTSFLPSNTTLPANIKHMQFKTLLGAQNAIAVLLNMNGGPGNFGSFNNVFLGSGDDFAFAAGKDFILAKLNFQVQPIPPFWVYTVSLGSPTVDFQNGKIVLTITGHAHTPKWYLPDFNFRVKQAFTLNPVATTPGGPLDTAELALLGDISLEISGIPDWVVNRFSGGAMDVLRQRRDENLGNQQPNVRNMFSVHADSNPKTLGDFLNSLLKPPQQKPGDPPPQELKAVLAYTSVEIRPSGIVLQGSLAVPYWPPAHVEFEEIPVSAGGFHGGVVTGGPDYSALKSWIPGGTIQQYEWSSQGQGQPFVDTHRFVLLYSRLEDSGVILSTTPVSGFAPPSTIVVSGYTPLCLTVKGVRFSSSGPVVEQPVIASNCGYTTVSLLARAESSLTGAPPMVALTHAGPRGLVEIVGHTAARIDAAGGDTPNRIVHFADDKTAAKLEFLLQALRESKREDAPAVVLAVLTRDQLANARYTAGVIYAEDQGGAWERAFGLKATRPPATFIVGRKGGVAWQHEGELDSETLAVALRKYLVAGGSVTPRMLWPNLRIGWPARDFLFEYAPGRDLTLRKLGEKCPVTLVFWNSLSKPSIETVRHLQKTARQTGGQCPVVLAINDEAPESAKKAAAEHGLSAILVMDPRREISLAYGVNIWPTIVFLDAFGLVRGIRYGRLAGEPVEAPSGKRLPLQGEGRV